MNTNVLFIISYHRDLHGGGGVNENPRMPQSLYLKANIYV